VDLPPARTKSLSSLSSGEPTTKSEDGLEKRHRVEFLKENRAMRCPKLKLLAKLIYGPDQSNLWCLVPELNKLIDRLCLSVI